MKIVITGITSFIGLNVARALRKSGHEICGLVRPSSTTFDALDREGLLDGCRILRLDLEALPGPGEENAALCAFQPDCWLHFAWDGVGSEGRSDRLIQQKNLEIAQNCYYLAAHLGCSTFLFSGSQAEYGAGDLHAPQPVSLYGKAKYAFGQWGKAQSGVPRFLHLRIYSVYGPGDHPQSLVSTAIDTFIRGGVFTAGPCTQLWNYMYIDDCARAICTVLESERSKGYVAMDIGSASGRVLREYVEAIHHACGGRGSVRFGARGNNAEGSADLIPDLRVLSATGFTEAYSFDAGIRKTIDARKGRLKIP